MPASASPRDPHGERFCENPDDRAAFELLEERLFMEADWSALAELYRRRQAAPSLADRPQLRAELAMRLGQLHEERLPDADAAIRAYTEAVRLDPGLRRALQGLRRVYASRSSWETVLQIGEQEAALAESGEERARILCEMGEIWQRALGDVEHAEELFARARREAGGALPAPQERPGAEVALLADLLDEPDCDGDFLEPDLLEALDDDPQLASGAVALDDDPQLASGAVALDDDPQLASGAVALDDDPQLESGAVALDDDPQLESGALPLDDDDVPLTMPEWDAEPDVGEQRSSRVIAVLERKLSAAEAAGEGLAPTATGLRLRIAQLRGGALGETAAAIAVLEPARDHPGALLEVAPLLAGLYEQLGRMEPLITLCESATDACEDPSSRIFWRRRAAEAARAVGDPEKAIAHLRALLEDRPRDRGARSALIELYRSRGDALPLVALLREELPQAGAEHEPELQYELATLLADDLDDPAGAIPHLRRCVALDPERSDLIDRALAHCATSGGPLAQLDLLDDAADRCESDRARAGFLARRGAVLADALAWQEEAVESWRAALELDPEQPLARQRMQGAA